MFPVASHVSFALAGIQVRAGPQTCRWCRPAIAAGAAADEPGGVTEHPPSRHVDARERSWGVMRLSPGQSRPPSTVAHLLTRPASAIAGLEPCNCGSFGRKILSLYYGSDSARADVLLAIGHARYGKHRLIPESGNKDNLDFGP